MASSSSFAPLSLSASVESGLMRCRGSRAAWLAAAVGAVLFIVGYVLLGPEIRYKSWSIQSADQFWSSNPQRSNVIVSLTSVPHRLDNLHMVVKNFMLQSVAPKAIHINLPRYSLRENQPYVVPEYLLGLQSVTIVRSDRDWGPATKFMVSLLDERITEDEPVLIVDDDYIYPADFVERFAAFADAYPSSVLAARGWDVPKSLRWADSGTVWGRDLVGRGSGGEPMPIDVVTGCGGILVRKKFFDLSAVTDFEHAPPEAFFVDDLWLSGNLAARGVERLVIPLPSHHTPQYFTLAWSKGLINNENKDGWNNDVLLKWFHEYWHYEPVSSSAASA